MHFRDLCSLATDEEVVALQCLPMNQDHGYLLFATRKGQVKRIQLADLPGVMFNEFCVMNIAKGDKLLDVLYTRGQTRLC